MLVVGLGNPGEEYKFTRHNIGFIFVDKIAKEFDIDMRLESKFKGIFGNGYVYGNKVYLLKPITFMNLSGESVSKVVNFYKFSSENILVIHDDLDLEVGKFKLKFGGSAGGHNGIKDIIKKLGTDKFRRLKIGIGHPGNKNLVVNYVLSKFKIDEFEKIMGNDSEFWDRFNQWIKEIE